MSSKTSQAMRLRRAWAQQQQLLILLRKIERDVGQRNDVTQGIETAVAARTEIRGVLDELFDETLIPGDTPPSNS